LDHLQYVGFSHLSLVSGHFFNAWTRDEKGPKNIRNPRVLYPLMRDTKWCSSLIFFLLIAFFFSVGISYAEGGLVLYNSKAQLYLPESTVMQGYLPMNVVMLPLANHSIPLNKTPTTYTMGKVVSFGGFHDPGEEKVSAATHNWPDTNSESSGYPGPYGAGAKEGPDWWTQAATAGSKAPALVIGGSASAPMREGSSANYPGAYQDSNNNYLWIENVQGRAQFSSIPQYSRISLVASTSNGGQGQFYELIQSTTSPSTYNSYNFNFQPGSNQIGFDASIVGRHILFYIIYNQPSNVVIVDVGGR
jgi:hypothetical protein